MAIVTIPDNAQLTQLIACTICGRETPLANLTAGLLDAAGKQQFACYGHSWDGNKFVLGWAAFAAKQRLAAGQAATQMAYRERGDVYIERRPVTGSEVVSWDVAHHLFARQLQGATVILTNKPVGLLSAVSKQWVKVTGKVQKERSSTLDATLVLELTKTITHMQNMVFTSQPPYDVPDANVYIMDASQLHDIPFGCHTVYVAEPIDEEQLAVIKEAMPHNGLVVIYR
jgi:hypothetical protein